MDIIFYSSYVSNTVPHEEWTLKNCWKDGGWMDAWMYGRKEMVDPSYILSSCWFQERLEKPNRVESM